MKTKDNLIIETVVGPVDFGLLVEAAEQFGVISPPMVVRKCQFSLPQAEKVLSDLAGKNYLDFLPESGVVPTYRVSKDGYARVEAVRSKMSILSGLFSQPTHR